jgi:hypothetical protein
MLLLPSVGLKAASADCKLMTKCSYINVSKETLRAAPT